MPDSSLTPIKTCLESFDPDIRWQSATPVGGGCIHRCYVLTSDNQHTRRQWFLKTNTAAAWPVLQAEAEGLSALHAACHRQSQSAIVTPKPHLCAQENGIAFLLMDYLPLARGLNHHAAQLLGAGLFHLHTHTAANGCFGFPHDNFIGATPQINHWESEWAEFFARHRLGHQLQLAEQNGHHAVLSRGWRVLRKLPVFFARHTPRPSLLHGDLWSGNVAGLCNGPPAMFDPAVYYGDRETDLAMMRLFGGFPAAVFSAYRQAAQAAGQPLPAESEMDFQRRIRIYQLYHWLNHLNLFGAGYLPAVQRCLDDILSV